MLSKVIPTVLASAAAVSACTLPTTPLSSTMGPIRVQIQNTSHPEVHNYYMNLFQAGGGDQHLFIGPVGVPTYDLVLRDGVIGRGVLNAVINGEVRQDLFLLVPDGEADRGYPKPTSTPRSILPRSCS